MRAEGPVGASTAKIAAEAHCSKETLYNWFGDREGLIAAIVEEQSQAMARALTGALSARAGARENLVRFCAALIDLLTGEASVLINRAAISQMGAHDELAHALWVNGRAQIVPLAITLLERARAEGLARFDDGEEAFATLFGLTIGERQVGAILGAGDARPTGEQMTAIAEHAVARLEAIYAGGAG